MKCPHCKGRLIHKSGTVTRVRIRGAIEIDEQGVARANCQWCKERIRVPLTLRELPIEVETFTVPTGAKS